MQTTFAATLSKRGLLVEAGHIWPWTLEKQGREHSLQDSMRASHKPAQLLDLRWEWMERTRARAKPQTHNPNFSNKHQTCECQLGTQMDVVIFFFFSLPSSFTANRPSALGELRQLLCGGALLCCAAAHTSAEGAQTVLGQTYLDGCYSWLLGGSPDAFTGFLRRGLKY